MKEDILLEFLNDNIDRVSFTNKKFLNELLEILQNYYGLNETLKGFGTFEKSMIPMHGYYESDDKKIFLNTKLIRNIKSDNKVVKNNFILETLFHELFHAYEPLIKEKDTVISSLLKDSDLVLMGKLWNNKEVNKLGLYYGLVSAKMYVNHQSLYPNERLANSVSNHYMYKLYKIMNSKNKELSYEIKKNFMDKLLEDYIISNPCITPLEQFYTKTGMIDRLNSYDFSIYSNYIRLMLGELKSTNDILQVQDSVLSLNK